MRRDRFEEILRRFHDRRIIVLGDLMMDEYLWGRATRISPESPVMVVEVESESNSPGGAANVVNNLLALGAKVVVIGIVGDDDAGVVLRSALSESGANVDGVVTDASRPTTRKTRVVAHSQQVLRVDRETAVPIRDEIAGILIKALNQEISDADGVIVSDYNKGVVTLDVATACVELAKAAECILTANPKPISARQLAGANVLQLNQSEADTTASLLGIMGEGIDRLNPFGAQPSLDLAGAALRSALDLDTLVVTRGARGLALWTRMNGPAHVEPHEVKVYDVAGAGDTVISALTLSLASGADIVEAAIVANQAAACVVKKVGVATATTNELLADRYENE